MNREDECRKLCPRIFSSISGNDFHLFFITGRERQIGTEEDSTYPFPLYLRGGGNSRNQGSVTQLLSLL